MSEGSIGGFLVVGGVRARGFIGLQFPKKKICEKPRLFSGFQKKQKKTIVIPADSR